MSVPYLNIAQVLYVVKDKSNNDEPIVFSKSVAVSSLYSVIDRSNAAGRIIRCNPASTLSPALAGKIATPSFPISRSDCPLTKHHNSTLLTMPSSSFKSTVSVTHITTATAILSIDDVNFLIDPTFDKSGDFEQEGGFVRPSDSRTCLSFTRFSLVMKTTSTTWTRRAEQCSTFKITGTPTQHLPGGECTGFVLESPSFGVNEADGLPNVVYVSGDTVHIPELANELPKKYHIVVALMNLGKAIAPLPTGPVQITMGGVQAAQLTRDIGAEKMVPLHFESWKHFTESGDDVRAGLAADAEVKDKVMWVVPGEKTTIV
ncbi:unnamed protein product [Phytophthora lilii]|uniref:Unnamed protein product n=1 Tax=Phytophthora lilii TaxID=2077276 RepID=A0A9W6TRH5_9STRA|nr:unnamed protein product [Phytophthora lilii]